MKRQRFHLVVTHCPRCGKEVFTGNRSLWGADSTKAKYNGICSNCITPEERAEMMKEISKSVYAIVSK